MLRDQMILDELADANLIVSLCYGKLGAAAYANNACWSVDVLNRKNGDSFEKPYSAETFDKAVSIANIESHKRGWMQPII